MQIFIYHISYPVTWIFIVDSLNCITNIIRFLNIIFLAMGLLKDSVDFSNVDPTSDNKLYILRLTDSFSSGGNAFRVQKSWYSIDLTAESAAKLLLGLKYLTLEDVYFSTKKLQQWVSHPILGKECVSNFTKRRLILLRILIQN